MGIDLGVRDAATTRAELARLGTWQGTPSDAPEVPGRDPEPVVQGFAVLAGWRMLLDAGRLQDGEPHLAGTARPPVARLAPVTAARIGAVEGSPVTVATPRGRITLPLAITEMPEQVVWLPLNSPGSAGALDAGGITRRRGRHLRRR